VLFYITAVSTKEEQFEPFSNNDHDTDLSLEKKLLIVIGVKLWHRRRGEDRVVVEYARSRIVC